MDKLSIVNLKLWHTQEWINQVSSPEDVKDFKEVYKQIRKLKDLNLQRNNLVEEIDTILDSAIKVGEAPIVRSNKCSTPNSAKTKD